MDTKRIISIAVAVVMVVTMGLSFDTARAASKPAKVKITKATSTQSTVTLKWKKAKRAKKYQVYRITKTYKKNGKTKYKYKKVATTKKRTCKVKNLKAGKTYKFRVRAVKGKKRESSARSGK